MTNGGDKNNQKGVTKEVENTRTFLTGRITLFVFRPGILPILYE